jgi:hypothetical protein
MKTRPLKTAELEALRYIAARTSSTAADLWTLDIPARAVYRLVEMGLVESVWIVAGRPVQDTFAATAAGRAALNPAATLAAPAAVSAFLDLVGV